MCDLLVLEPDLTHRNVEVIVLDVVCDNRVIKCAGTLDRLLKDFKACIVNYMSPPVHTEVGIVFVEFLKVFSKLFCFGRALGIPCAFEDDAFNACISAKSSFCGFKASAGSHDDHFRIVVHSLRNTDRRIVDLRISEEDEYISAGIHGVGNDRRHIGDISRNTCHGFDLDTGFFECRLSCGRILDAVGILDIYDVSGFHTLFKKKIYDRGYLGHGIVQNAEESRIFCDSFFQCITAAFRADHQVAVLCSDRNSCA